MQALPFKPSQTSVNLPQIQNIVRVLTKSLLGQPLGWVSIAYGDELHLHFGQENIKTLKSGRIQKKGDWILNTSASLWTLEKDNQAILTSAVFELNAVKQNLGYVQLDQVFQSLSQLSLLSLEIINTDFITVLKLGDRHSLKISPNPKATALPYWELFMPTEQVLILEGKSPFWSCQSIYSRH